MDMDDLKEEVISHLAEMSDLTAKLIGERQECNYYVKDKDPTKITEWDLFEDKNKVNTKTDWIEKEATGDILGRITLEETRLYFEPKISPPPSMEGYQNPCGEKMLLADLIAPDSFDVAIDVLKHTLNVLRISKPPKGVGQFGSMTPPFPMPPFGGQR